MTTAPSHSPAEYPISVPRVGQVTPSRPLIVTIDGPAGTGKSSVARVLAKRLGVEFLDTGAMYRAAAAIAVDRKIQIENHEALVAAVSQTSIRFDWKTDPPTLMADGVSMMERIRDKDVTAVVSPIAGIAELRRIMVRMQRQIGHDHPRLVTEGRDQGSVVFPDADVKIYLYASPEVRAARRAEQLAAAGHAVDRQALLRDIIERDRSDSTRHDGPLTCPEGAHRVDTSNLSFDQVVELLEKLVLDEISPRRKKKELELAGHSA